jgi:hypothetical protein
MAGGFMASAIALVSAAPAQAVRVIDAANNNTEDIFCGDGNDNWR